MATTKKTTKAKPAAKKKAAPKKASAKKAPAKKAAPKKAAPKAAPAPAPAPAMKHRTMTLMTNAGQMSINFVDDRTFDAALNVVTGAPRDGGGSRTPPPVLTITGTNGSFSFRTVSKCSIHEH
jgi:membrane protein involved in colicin uptake